MKYFQRGLNTVYYEQKNKKIKQNKYVWMYVHTYTKQFFKIQCNKTTICKNFDILFKVVVVVIIVYFSFMIIFKINLLLITIKFWMKWKQHLMIQICLILQRHKGHICSK